VRAARDRRSGHKDWDCKATHNFLLSVTAFAQPGSSLIEMRSVLFLLRAAATPAAA
jgi:hypothetical protein